MKLLKQVRLEFREGTSDKVYEVDLCEVGSGQFVVNFRYGRRGTALRDGSKTPAPVPQARAEKIFNDLIAEKRRGGYRDFGTTAAPTPPQPSAPTAAPTVAPSPSTVLDGRAQGVLNRLRQGFAGSAPGPRGKKPWRLSRAIWRAGELGLDATEPVLLDLLQQVQQRKAQRTRKPKRDQLDRNDVEHLLGERFLRLPHNRWGTAQWSENFTPPEDLFLYVLAWSLGRCGSAASVPALQELRTEPWEPIGRMATTSLLLILQGGERAALLEELTSQLPARLGELCRRGPAEAFQQALLEYPLDAEGHGQIAQILDTLYLLDHPHTRPALLQVLRTVPLPTAFFQAIRHIFKMAELRRDAEVFGILAHRFETAPKGDFRVQVPTTQYTQNQVRQSHATLFPFSKDGTRRYLRMRSWRTLRRLGEVGDPDYVRMAVEVLLPFTDADAQEPVVWRTSWERVQTGRYQYSHRAVPQHRDRFGRFWAFNHILYHNSPRYQPVWQKAFFTCNTNYQPGGPEPAEREEAFPGLWEAAPEALLHLLEASRCQPVHHFAVKVLRTRPDFCRRIDVPTLARLLEVPYEVTLELALELAVQRYDPAAPDHALVLALANCGLGRARQQAHTWIDQNRAWFVGDAAFLAALAGSPQADTRSYARALLRQTIFTPEGAQVLVGRLVALLRSFTAEEGGRAQGTALTLQLVFAAQLRSLGVDVIRDLLAHPLPEVRQFAGELVLGHDTLSRQPPQDILQRLLQDSEASVRAVGVRLFGQLPDLTLKESIDLLVALSRHELPEFRENIRPVVRRLAEADPAFGRSFAARLAEALLVPGAPEGIPSYTARLLREDLLPYLGGVPVATIWKLLQSRSPPAQEVGGLLLASNVRPQDLSLAEIVKLASHDILSVREAAWQMCRDSLERLKQDMDTATRLVDAKWEDSRQFAFNLLRDAFGPGELTPEVLVSLCDSVRPDVQQFGREMITRLFVEEHGPKYAVELSEHPSPSMQMFTANFLERFAGTSAERLRQLTFYFQSVLSRVNQGRVAKDRAFRFLEQAARAGEDSAVVVAEILGRQSATMAVHDKARAIEILTRIRTAYPTVASPLRIKPVEVRHGV